MSSVELKQRPTVSLVIMALNAEATIERTIRSVEEHVDDLELVDSGSSDKTVEIVLDWGRRTGKPAFVSYFSPVTRPEAFIKDSPENFEGAPEKFAPYTGLPLLINWAALRNFTLAQGTGDYVLMMDADDVWVKGHIPDMVRHMEHHKGDTMTTNYEYDSGGKICQGRNYTWRIFRRSSIGTIINFEGPTHEAITFMGKVLAASDVVVRDTKENKGVGVRVPNRALKILWHYCNQRNWDWNNIDQRWHYYLAVESRGAIPEKSMEWMNLYFQRSDTPLSMRANMRLGLGDLYMAMGDNVMATESFLLAASELEYPDPYFHAARSAYQYALEAGGAGEVELRKSRVETVVNLLNKGLSLVEPKVNPVILINPALRPSSYVLLADCLGFLGRFSEAISVAEKALMMFPEADESQRQIWETCIQLSKTRSEFNGPLKKPDLSDLTLVIAFSLDSPERLENLKTVLTRFEGTNVKIVIVEQGEKCNLLRGNRDDLLREFNNVENYFLKRTDGVFHRTYMLNFGLKKVMTPFVAIYDCDVIFEWSSVYSAMEILRTGKAEFVYPYNGHFMDTARSYIQDLLNDNFGVIQNAVEIDYDSVGGCFFADAKIYRTVGGENENFISWGQEDHERVLRFKTLGYQIMRTAGACYHIHHPRGPNSNHLNPAFAGNMAEFKKVLAMQANVEAMLSYVKSFPWYSSLNPSDETFSEQT